MKINVITELDEHVQLDASNNLSLMEILRNNGLNIAAQCGGEASCGTCHVYVDEKWLGRLLPSDDTELAMLEFVEERQTNSRLSCQIKVSEELDGLIVRIAPGSPF